MVMKTTILLRDDVYETLVNKFGKRKISENVNKILFKDLIKKEDYFGILKGKKLKPFERDRYERKL
ncbi:MAG: hypothetical protein V1740_06460 [Candidatus Woesearchaeota archaeon]